MYLIFSLYQLNICKILNLDYFQSKINKFQNILLKVKLCKNTSFYKISDINGLSSGD